MLLAHDIDGPVDGDPVVLLHSSVADRRMWQPQWRPLLNAGLRVLRADFRGHGDSPVPDESFNNADDVRVLLDTLGLDRVTLVGSSFGGRISLEFAARWPARVGTLALLCAAMADHPKTPDIEAFGEREDELLEAGDVDGAVELNVRTFLGPDADEATRASLAMMQRRAFDVQLAAPDVSPIVVPYEIGAITARTLVVSGSHDLDYFTEIAAELANRIPNASYTRLDWAGHLPSLENPALFNPLLLDFLRPWTD